MKRRLSPRAGTIGAAGVVLFLAGSTAQAGWLFVLSAGVLGLVVGSLFVRQHLLGAEIERSVPRRSRVGDEVRVGLRVKNASRRRLPLMRVTDTFDAFEPVAAVSERLGPGASARLEQVRKAHLRGAFGSGSVELRAGAPFGFMSTRRVVEVESPFIVVPRWVELTSFPILEPSSIPSDVLHERARTGAGEEYMGVREYRPGDPRRAVHWRSTARVGKLVVREFEEEVASKVVLVLAGRDDGVPPDSSFECLVEASASIALYALQTGHPIDLLKYAPDGTTDRLDGPDRLSVLDWLARAQPHDEALAPLVFESLARIGRRGTCVILSSTAGAAGAQLVEAVRTVQTAGSRAIVVTAKSSSWNGDVIEEEQHALDQMQRNRVAVRAISKGDDLFSCLTSLN